MKTERIMKGVIETAKVTGKILIELAKITIYIIAKLAQLTSRFYRFLQVKTGSPIWFMVWFVMVVLFFLTAPKAEGSSIMAGNQGLGEKMENLSPEAQKQLKWANAGLYAKAINEYVKDTPMAGTGEIAIETAYTYDLPPYLIVAIAKHETNLGRLGDGYDAERRGVHNAWGLGVHLGWDWRTWPEAYDKMGFTLRNYYFNEGRTTPETIEDKWAPGIENSYGYEWSAGVNRAGADIVAIENKLK